MLVGSACAVKTLRKRSATTIHERSTAGFKATSITSKVVVEVVHQEKDAAARAYYLHHVGGKLNRYKWTQPTRIPAPHATGKHNRVQCELQEGLCKKIIIIIIIIIIIK